MEPINRDTKLLAPKFQAKLNDFLYSWNKNYPKYPLYVFEGFRSWKRQKELYESGRAMDYTNNSGYVVVDKKKILTNAQPGQSFHNYGLAADLVFDGNPQTQRVDWDWSNTKPWAVMGREVVKYGFEWAGSWKAFPEAPHIQLAFGHTIQEVAQLYQEGGLAKVWADLGAN